jgi:rhodanese-related sulfurtransferase
VYCSSETCPISQYAYEALDKLGYEEIYDMRAGLQGWKEAGLPTAFGSDSTAGSR